MLDLTRLANANAVVDFIVEGPNGPNGSTRMTGTYTMRDTWNYTQRLIGNAFHFILSVETPKISIYTQHDQLRVQTFDACFHEATIHGRD